MSEIPDNPTPDTESPAERAERLLAAAEAALPEALAPFVAISGEPPDVRHNKVDSFNRRIYAFREVATPTTITALLDEVERLRDENERLRRVRFAAVDLATRWGFRDQMAGRQFVSEGFDLLNRAIDEYEDGPRFATPQTPPTQDER